MEQAKTKENKQQKNLTYDSNPFTLAFNSLGRLFKHNAGWAIAILVIGFLSWVVRCNPHYLMRSSRHSTLFSALAFLHRSCSRRPDLWEPSRSCLRA